MRRKLPRVGWPRAHHRVAMRHCGMEGAGRPKAALLDLDRLAVAEAAGGAGVGFIQAANPEIHDRANAKELLAARVSEMLAGLRRDHPIHDASAALPEAGRTLESGEASLELSDPVGRGYSGRLAWRPRPSPRPSCRFGHGRPPRLPALAGASNWIRNVPSSIFAPFVGASTRARGSNNVRRQPPTWSTSSSDRRLRCISPRSVNGSSTRSTYIPFSRSTR